VEKKKGKQHSGVCFTENFHQKEIPKGSSFFSFHSPLPFLVVVKGDLILTFPNIILVQALVLFFGLFSFSFFLPFFLCGAREKRRETLHCKKEEKKKREQNKNNENRSAASSSSTKVFLTKPIFWYEDHGYTTRPLLNPHLEFFLSFFLSFFFFFFFFLFLFLFVYPVYPVSFFFLSFLLEEKRKETRRREKKKQE